MKLELLVFNPFQVNTYLLYDETGQCLVLDPGCSGHREEEILKKTIRDKGLQPVMCVNTHCHVDHILGNGFVFETYGLAPVFHPLALPFYEAVEGQARMFGLESVLVPPHGDFIKEGDMVSFGNSRLRVIYTPGHADGSICLISRDHRLVLSGDVLFRDSIGRTDLQTGDFDTLMQSIHQKLFTLEDDYRVYPGHGPDTTIGYEKLNNPYVGIF
ncbi:MAG: MBL fold metallo-hydrolase [Bacteroidales bacterium]|nr:MBL fold metallo-hydrolase [Bacteroidales bacterium]